jgi:ubiquinone/menaquinone biosynthesis C-methylase UbiE
VVEVSTPRADARRQLTGAPASLRVWISGLSKMTTEMRPLELSPGQQSNADWWDGNPMTYDWENTMRLPAGSREWYEEIDRRFLAVSYFAKGEDGRPFGRFMKPEPLKGKDVLEVGCGMGTHASMLARAGARLTAIDLTERAVAATKRRFELFNLDGVIQQADAENLPFASASFDCVWSWGVIHHSNRFESCLSEIGRVLRSGGRLLLMVYYRPSIAYYVNNGLIRGVLMAQLLRKSLQQIYVDSGDGYYARVFNKRELHERLSRDFTNVKLSVVGLKAELFPIPRTQFKVTLEAATPDAVASAVLGRWGSMIVAEATRQ